MLASGKHPEKKGLVRRERVPRPICSEAPQSIGARSFSGGLSATASTRLASHSRITSAAMPGCSARHSNYVSRSLW